MYRPSQTPRQSLSSERIAIGPKPLAWGQKRESFDSLSALPNKKRDDESSGISLAAETSHLCYASHVPSQRLTRVKLNRVFFPRYFFQARSLGCGFAR